MEANGQDPLRDFPLKNNFCVLGDTEVLAHDLKTNGSSVTGIRTLIHVIL